MAVSMLANSPRERVRTLARFNAAVMGMMRAARMAMTAMTTSNSIKVKAREQIPKSKSQTPKKFQLPNPKREPDGFFDNWGLEFFWDLGFAIWNFIFTFPSRFFVHAF